MYYRQRSMVRRRLLTLYAAVSFLFLPLKSAPAQVAFNEIMFDPLGPESTDEFIELLNLSTADSVDLDGWWLSDGRGVDSLRGVEEGLILAPGGFAVVLDPAYFANSTSYDGLIPGSALVLSIDNATFGSGGLSNSVGRTLYLVDDIGDTLSIYTYSPDNTPGHSDEKVDPSGPNTPENWQESRETGGTPGAANSVTPLSIDLSLDSEIGWRPERPRAGENVELHFGVTNTGLNQVSGYRIAVHDDVDRDSLLVDGELVASGEGGSLEPGDTQTFTLGWHNPDPGYHALFVQVDVSGDRRLDDNSAWVDIVVGFVPGALVINEFMYRPMSDEPEWVELFNPGPQAVSLRNWGLGDAGLDQPVSFGVEEVVVAPGSYRIVAAGTPIGRAFVEMTDSVLVPASRFPTLNNGGDTILLFDPLGSTIDSVAYTSSWGDEIGRSLEKIWFERSPLDASNWAPSLDTLRATPGRMNSVSPRSHDLGISSADLLLYPERPRAGETVLLTAVVRNLGRSPVEGFQVQIYDDADHDSLPDAEEEIGRRAVSRRLESEEFANIEFDLGMMESGWHLVLVRLSLSADQRPENNLARVRLAVGFPERVVVINEIMFDAGSGESEWIELYNRSPSAVDLLGWSVADSSGAFELPRRPLILDPAAFVVLAGDSSVLGRYGSPAFDLVALDDFPTLNNDIDGVFLVDMQGSVIDAVRYRGDWGAGPGISLERLHPDLPSADSTTWYPSVEEIGATPGRVNSIFTAVPPVTTELHIAPNPFSPDDDGVDDFAVVSFRLPEPRATVNLKIYDMRGRLVRQLLNNAASGAQRRVIWDGRSDRGDAMRVGIYIVYLEAIRPEVGFLRRAKQTVVLARRW